MRAGLLWLLCLGLCLCDQEEEEREKPPRPSLSAWPSFVQDREGSVNLLCQGPLQAATFLLGKLHDPGFQWEQGSANGEAVFPLSSLQPQDAGPYFCAYRATAAHRWSEPSLDLQLVVTGSLPAPSLAAHTDARMALGLRILSCLAPLNGTGCIMTALLKAGVPKPLQVRKVTKNQADFTLQNVTRNDNGIYSCVYFQCELPYLGSSPSHSLQVWVTDDPDGHKASTPTTENRVIFVTAFSCLSIFLLFLSVIFIYRCIQPGPAQEAATPDRTSHSRFPVQEAADSPWLGRTPSSMDDPQGADCVNLNAHVPAEVAPVPPEESPGPGTAVLDV